MLLLLFLLFAATQTVVISSISNDLVGGEINLLDAGIVDVLGLYRVMFNQTTKGNETDDLFPLQSVNRSAEITAIFSNLTLFEGNQTSSTQSIVDIGYTLQYFGTLTSPSPLKEVFFQIFGINVDDAFIDEFRQRISRNRDSSFQQIIENMKKKGDTRKARLQLKSFFGSSFEVSTIIDHTLSDEYCIFGAQVFQTFPLLAVEIKETLLPSRFTVMFTRLVGFYNQGQYFINTILQHLQLILLPLFFLRALEILQSDFQLKLQKLFDQTSFTGVSNRKSSNLVSTSMKPNLDVIRQQSFTVRQELLNDLKWFKNFFDQTNDDLRLEYHELYEMTSYALHFLRFCYDPTSLPTNKGDYALTSPLENVSNFYYSWETLQPYQYGLAPTSYPLRATIRRFFALPTKYHKVFVIITDGRGWNNQNDDSKVIDLAHNFQHKEEVLLINCYLSSEKEEISMKQELYYHKNTNNWSLTEQSLFERSSEVRLKTAAVLLLERMGWIVPQEGKCRLFIRTNLVSVLKFAVSLTRIISENRHQIIYDKMVHVANFARKIDHYHSSFVAPRQIGGTCYAYALAAVIYLNSARVIGRPSLNFHDLVEEIIMANIQSKKSLPDFEGESDSELRDGGNMNFLQSFPSLKRLRWAEVSEFEARKAVLSGRVVLTIFGLTQTRWNQFSRIYSDPTAKGTVITDIGEAGSQYDHSSHAVVLVDAEPDHLKFMNSWGSSWADNGCFRVSTLPEYDLMSIMRFHFFDVYWEPEDLNEDEKLAYQHLYNHLFS